MARVRAWLAAITITIGTGQAQAQGAHRAILSADMTEMIAAIIARYENAGLSWDPAVTWEIGPFTTTYWFYDANEKTIVVGAVPNAAEIDTYWQTWSAVLTDGQFDPKSFFASENEALDMALYNQFVLATHESAHAITYRYDFDHNARHDYAVNCREYYADRLTVGILNDMAGEHPDLERWRDRYHELVRAMGETIPAQYRHAIPSYKALEKDCAIIDVRQPTPERMQAYASAYFERYDALLGAELPDMDALFDAHLLARQRALFDAIPPAPESAELVVTNGAVVPRIEVGSVYNDVPDGFSVTQAIEIAPDGTIYVTQWRRDRNSGLVSVLLGRNDDPLDLVISDLNLGDIGGNPELSSMTVAAGSAALLTIETSADLSHLYQLARTDGEWRLDLIYTFDNYGEARVLRRPDSRIVVALSDYRLADGTVDESWRVVTLSPEGIDLDNVVALPVIIDDPIGVDLANRLYFDHDDSIIRISETGQVETFAGSFLTGNREGPAIEAEFVWVREMQFVGAEDALVLDTVNGDWSRYLLRNIAPE